jgi:hypothetical protein
VRKGKEWGGVNLISGGLVVRLWWVGGGNVVKKQGEGEHSDH